MSILIKLYTFFKKETVLAIAGILAMCSCFVITPDSMYIGYIDERTLILLFCLMAVTTGLKEVGLFEYIGEKLLDNVKSERGIIAVLTALCFFGSMVVTNDVALIVFIPFGILVLRIANMEGLLCLAVTLMTIAANLGSMLTPIGNPQNLYLYSLSGFSIGEFILITLPYTLLSALMLGISILLVCRNKKISKCQLDKQICLEKGKLVYYLIAFGLCLLSVAGLLEIEILLVIILAAVLVENNKLLGKIDYSLLATFVCLFIFIGNMGRLPAFQQAIIRILEGRERLVGVGISQIISNVPAALLLSGFTGEWKELIIGTNLGGLGTLIASMASLISYKQLALQYPEQKARYLLTFTAWNIAFLDAIWGISSWLL